MADKLRTALDVTLTKDEAEYIAAFIADENVTDEDVVRLMVGDGHAGYGLYAAHPEYPEEGAILVKNLPEPGGVPPSVVPSLTEEEREHIHQAIDMLGDYEVTQRELGNDSTSAGASATRYVLQKLFRLLPGRTAGVKTCPESGKHCKVVSGECQTCGADGVPGTYKDVTEGPQI